MISIQVVSSPFEEPGDHPFPWTYDADAFATWVYETLMEGYKNPTEEVPEVPISLEEAVDFAEEMGYGLVIKPRLASS